MTTHVRTQRFAFHSRRMCASRIFHCLLRLFFNTFWYLFIAFIPFPHSSVGKESTCNAGDPSSIPGSGKSPGEGLGYLLQYSWTSLVAQLVKNPPAMWETWVWSLSWQDPLEKWKSTHSSILDWIYSPWGHKELDRTEQLSLHFTSFLWKYQWS